MAEKKEKTKTKTKAKAKNATKRSVCISINLLPPEYRKVKKDISWITDRRIVWPTLAIIVAIVVFM